MKVRDIMTREVVSCDKDTTLATAARLMLRGHFGTLPVVDAQGRGRWHHHRPRHRYGDRCSQQERRAHRRPRSDDRCGPAMLLG
jgi:CBS domain-containing protein